jgi:enoyl-CoA hydratase
MSVRTKQDGHVRTVVIDREEARNALNGEVLDGLVAAFDAARDDDGVRVVVLTGAGEKAFCAGADLAGGLQGGDGGAVAEHEARGMLRELFAAVERLDKPLVGRLNGHALAGGMGVALACDLLVAAADVQLGTPEVKVGLWPFVISALIAEHVGPKRALDLMMTGRRIAAEEAVAWGLVNRVVPRAALDDAVRELADELAGGSPVAMKLGRRSFHEARDMGPHAAMAYLHGMLDLATRTEDVVEGVTAFFQKRPPEWKGR